MPRAVESCEFRLTTLHQAVSDSSIVCICFHAYSLICSAQKQVMGSKLWTLSSCIMTNQVRMFTQLIGQMCLELRQESKYRKKVLYSGLGMICEKNIAMQFTTKQQDSWHLLTIVVLISAIHQVKLHQQNAKWTFKDTFIKIPYCYTLLAATRRDSLLALAYPRMQSTTG